MKTLTLTDAQYDDLIGIIDSHMSAMYSEQNVPKRYWDEYRELFASLDARVEYRDPSDLKGFGDCPTLVKLDERSPSRPIE